jgi:hypothetical protein
MIATTATWWRRTGVAAALLRSSGVIGAVGVVTLLAMYAGFAMGARQTAMTIGWVNDVTGIVTLPLAIPGIVAFHARLRPEAGRTGDRLLVVAIGATGVIAVLQLLLVIGALPFEQQIGPVTIAFLVMLAYFVLIGRIATRAGVMPNGALLGVGAGLYVGYPLWTFRVARVVEAAPAALTVPAAARG